MGLLLNEDRSFDLNNSYLVLYSIGTISLLYLTNKFDFDDLIPVLMYFLIFILTLSIFELFISTTRVYMKLLNIKFLLPYSSRHFTKLPSAT